MDIKILGSAAGGGFPQWNCACRNCVGVRNGTIRAEPRTQLQLALRLPTSGWLLVNASPDLRAQILSSPALSPKELPRESPIAAIVLTSADVDSVAGLLHLREFQPLQIYATPSVRRILAEENRIFRVLNRSNPPAVWQDIKLDNWLALPDVDSSAKEAELCCRAISLGGSYPDYVSESLRKSLPPEEAVIGLTFLQGGKKMFFAPSIPSQSDLWKTAAHSSDLCFMDGTFWTDDELIHVGGSSKTAREIGHIPLGGPGGLFEKFGPAGGGRRVLIHINNTNPILDEDSLEHAEALRRGWQIARDGMEFHL
jgi:pyrroloquinoline quinone biosynthesis protein B